MMRVITALGRFRSSGLSAISFTALGSLEPGLPIICGTAADLGRELCRARAWQTGKSPSRLKKLASENAPPEKEGRGYRRQTSNRLLHLIDWLGLFLNLLAWPLEHVLFWDVSREASKQRSRPFQLWPLTYTATSLAVLNVQFKFVLICIPDVFDVCFFGNSNNNNKDNL